MDLELATLEDIATELSHREVRFALIFTRSSRLKKRFSA